MKRYFRIPMWIPHLRALGLRCPKCQSDRRLDEFYTYKKGKLAGQPYACCRTCSRHYEASRRAIPKIKERLRLRAIDFRQKHKERLAQKAKVHRAKPEVKARLSSRAASRRNYQKGWNYAARRDLRKRAASLYRQPCMKNVVQATSAEFQEYCFKNKTYRKLFTEWKRDNFSQAKSPCAKAFGPNLKDVQFMPWRERIASKPRNKDEKTATTRKQSSNRSRVSVPCDGQSLWFGFATN